MQGRREWTEMKWWRDKKLLKTKWLNTNGTKKKRQNLLMAEATVNEIYLNGIKLLLQVDEINNALNILYFKAKRAGIKMRGAVKKINKAGALV